jgi:kynureninase
MMGDFTRQDALDLDAADVLAPLRDAFSLPEGMIYLDGNSLGVLPRATASHLAKVVEEQWGRDLVTSWNRHDWIGLPQRIGRKIAPLIGAGGDEVIACDSTSINLFKLIAAAVEAQADRTVILVEEGGFPTDRYMADAVAGLGIGREVCALPRETILSGLDESVAVLVLSHVDYRSGHMFDMATTTAAAHARGALVLWDLSHSAGAVAVDLGGCGADLAVGCGYKYLNGGPGAPAYLFVRRDLQGELPSILSGWMGHARPFAFEQGYEPAEGLSRFLCGTPSVLAMAALEQGLDAFERVDLDHLFAKGRALGDLYLMLIETRCAGQGFTLASPRSSIARGSHVCFAHERAYPICRAMIERGVVGDFRTPDLLRMGFTPLYTRFVDIWDAVEAIRRVMEDRAWTDERLQQREAVT